MTPGSTVSLVLPRDQVDRAAKGQRLHGTVLKAGVPVTRLLADFIVSLSEVSAAMEQKEALALEDAAIALLAAGLASNEPPDAAESPVLTHVLRRRVLEFIDANLAQPELGPGMLLGRFHVSRTHLYRMFASDCQSARKADP